MIKINSDLDQNIVSGPIVINCIHSGIFLHQSLAQYYGKILSDYVQLHEGDDNLIEGMELKNLANLFLSIK